MSDLLKKRETENNLQYRARLYREKIEIGMNNREIYEHYIKETGDTIAESSCRCSSATYNLALEDVLESQINNSENKEAYEIDEKIKELKKERKKLSITKNEYNRNFNKDVTREMFFENLMETSMQIPLPNFEPLKSQDKESEHILSWTDLHYGADFISENNSYSREECKRRFENLVGQVNNLVDKNKINKLNVFGLGDDIQGLLRLSDVKLNDIPVVRSVVEVSRLIAIVLNQLSIKTKIVYYHTMASNHSQTRPITGKADLVKEDMQVIIGEWIKDLCSHNNRIEVVLSDKDYSTVTLLDQNILLLHGHQIKNIKSVVKDYSMLHQKFYSIAFLGHFHAGMQTSVSESDNGNIEVVVVPSFVGSCPYSDSLMVGSKAMAKYYRIEEGSGIVENRTFVLN